MNAAALLQEAALLRGKAEQALRLVPLVSDRSAVNLTKLAEEFVERARALETLAEQLTAAVSQRTKQE
jgi:DNA-binding transcriptional LysR family regulator